MDELTTRLVGELVDIGRSGLPAMPVTKPDPRRGYPSILSGSPRRGLAGEVAECLSRDDFRDLIRGLILYSRAAGPRFSGGSASPVPPLHRRFGELYPSDEPALTRWIVEHRVNRYDPFGTIMYAESLSAEAHQEAVRAQLKEREERERRDAAVALRLRSQKATPKLANAVGRGDVATVKALLERGADRTAVERENGPLVDLARQNDRQRMVEFLSTLDG